MKPKKSWKEKLLDSKDLPKVGVISNKQEKRWGEGTIVVPAPIEVDAIMKSVPRGKVITINQIRKKIAKKHNVTTTCPITTGIFSWIAANAAAEDAERSRKFTPYWRTLREGGVINEKYPGGIEKQAILLEKEGHQIVNKGSKWIVADWEKTSVKN
jgi:hypothetical protein